MLLLLLLLLLLCYMLLAGTLCSTQPHSLGCTTCRAWLLLATAPSE
jgi:hypothetical protein